MIKYTWSVYHLSTCIYVLVHEIYTGMYRKRLLNTLKLTYPASGLKFGLVFIYIHTLQYVRAAEKV